MVWTLVFSLVSQATLCDKNSYLVLNETANNFVRQSSVAAQGCDGLDEESTDIPIKCIQ